MDSGGTEPVRPLSGPEGERSSTWPSVDEGKVEDELKRADAEADEISP